MSLKRYRKTFTLSFNAFSNASAYAYKKFRLYVIHGKGDRLKGSIDLFIN